MQWLHDVRYGENKDENMRRLARGEQDILKSKLDTPDARFYILWETHSERAGWLHDTPR